MTPKEKALNFTEKFIAPTMDRGLCGYFKSIAIAKECALIAVDELIKEARFSSEYIEEVFFTTGYYDKQDYWQEVKQEIEKL
jgi:hypothetical protein